MSYHILAISSSGRAESVSTALVHDVISRLKQQHPGATLKHREVGLHPIAPVDEAWISGAFQAPDARSPEQVRALQLSEELVDELLAADALVIGVPIYNFSVPAALKAWVDQIVRAGRTFAFDGPGQFRPLVPAGKKVFLALASGGVPAGSDADLATHYLKLVLGFVGLVDVTVIAADQLVVLGAGQVDKARARIAELSV